MRAQVVAAAAAGANVIVAGDSSGARDLQPTDTNPAAINPNIMQMKPKPRLIPVVCKC
jgi:hypothetical protein